jgi:hypothetical protein
MRDATLRTIDLAWAGTDIDGTQVYAPPCRAVAMQLCSGIGWLLAEYPRETVGGVALASVVGACVYFARDAIKHGSARKSPRRRQRLRRAEPSR